MYTSLLLALPFIAGAIAHPHAAHGPRHHPHLAGPLTEREAFVLPPRSIPKGHLGFAPHNADSIKSIAGMKRDGQTLVRRKRKRSCKAQQPVAVSSAVNAPVAATSAVASSSTASPASTTTSAAVTEAVSSAIAASSSYVEKSSAPSSAAAPVSTGAPSGLGGLMAFVFPHGKGTAGWTTVPDNQGSLSFDGALKPLQFGKLPDAQSAPDGANALVAKYPAGTFKYSASTGHGYSFYSNGDKDGVICGGAKEVMMSYSVFFESGFDFVKGGKLPGLYGGTSLDNAKSCSGGRQDGRDSCFSARLMWRADGAGEIYNYLPSASFSAPGYCDAAPYSKCDPAFGESIGRGAFTWATGQWTTVAIRLKMNDVGQTNGEQELFVNGQSVISLTGLTIGTSSDTKIYGIMAQTFFGGGDASWASPKDQSAWFKDWSLAVLA